jgi:hypothetical protein
MKPIGWKCEKMNIADPSESSLGLAGLMPLPNLVHDIFDATFCKHPGGGASPDRAVKVWAASWPLQAGLSKRTRSI